MLYVYLRNEHNPERSHIFFRWRTLHSPSSSAPIVVSVFEAATVADGAVVALGMRASKPTVPELVVVDVVVAELFPVAPCSGTQLTVVTTQERWKLEDMS